MLQWRELDERINNATRVLVTTHVRPDGDALGSELAFAELLQQRGKQVEIFNASPTPHRYRFLDPDGSRIGAMQNGKGEPKGKPDLFVVLDTGTWSQLSGLADYVRALNVPKVVIDHHISQDDLGALRLVDSSASACGMLVHEAFERLGGRITPPAATAMFTAIAMDTGWMRHSNTTPEVFAVLEKLVANGAKPHEIYRYLFEADSVGRMKLLGVLLGRITLLAGGRLATSHIHWQDIFDAGAHPMDTEDFVNFLMSIAGVETAVLFIEQAEGGTKVSFRSRGQLDCSRLAEQFGGGGHRPAAGATLKTPLAQAQAEILAATEATMRENG